MRYCVSIFVVVLLVHQSIYDKFKRVISLLKWILLFLKRGCGSAN
ncbi:MAG: hypothetical protein BAJALOKI3v1_440013 [Promethearchaeota archaeon]|nr:MAG: hypothetical protein BAJALOKI3v1_440013 [Candidatus Lokiarchaeota archaeon]